MSVLLVTGSFQDPSRADDDACMCLCVQIGPGHGDFGKHVGQYSGRENSAVRPSQQSSLQTVQTGECQLNLLLCLV